MQNRKHNSRSAILDPRSSILHPRSAFSFAEVMFAVVILGIGFIMVAAVFPVAIQQTQTTGEENTAAAAAREAANSISQLPTTMTNAIQAAAYYTNPKPVVGATPVTVPTELLFPPTVKNYVQGSGPNAVAPPAIVVPLLGNRWDLIKSNVILPSDPRFAYVAFYKRDSNSSAAQLIIVSVAIRNRPIYDTTVDLTNYPTPNHVLINNTIPGDFPAQAIHTIICPDTIKSSAVTAANPQEGSYFEIPTTPTGYVAAGRSYTLGAYISNSGVSELMAGDAMELSAGTTGWGTRGALTDVPMSSQDATLHAPATLQPTVAYAQLYTTPTAPNGLIILSNTSDMLGSANVAPPTGPAAQGAFVIIADDFPITPIVSSPTSLPDYFLFDNIASTGPNTPSYSVGSLNGRIFRLGTPVAGSPGTFNLDPAYAMRPATAGNGLYSPDAMPNPDMCKANMITPLPPPYGPINPPFTGAAKVYIIGAGRTNPTVTGSGYSGAAQDSGIFETYFQVQ